MEPSVIQALDRLPGSKSLVAPFQAFKFASDSAVKFQMTVSYCLDTCPPVRYYPPCIFTRVLPKILILWSKMHVE